MPVNSPNYPPEGFRDRVVNVQATGSMTGRLNEDNGALTTLALRMTTMGVGSCVWEALAYLDVIESRTRTMADHLSRELAGLGQDLAGIRQAIATLSTKLDDATAQLTALGVRIPAWTTEEGVLSGQWDDDMGMIYTPSASELGLVVELTKVQDQLYPAGAVIEIDPPADTFVSRGSRVKVTVNWS
ncbi:PASTA domain-containing protein [Nocardia sp. NPDC058519]|uniref:PASTA domain-containing protein n=1 Tax=Nocardia sp. NPDC058519 TaxID=3346535 RepID=UPI003657CB0B